MLPREIHKKRQTRLKLLAESGFQNLENNGLDTMPDFAYSPYLPRHISCCFNVASIAWFTSSMNPKMNYWYERKTLDSQFLLPCESEFPRFVLSHFQHIFKK